MITLNVEYANNAGEVYSDAELFGVSQERSQEFGNILINFFERRDSRTENDLRDSYQLAKPTNEKEEACFWFIAGKVMFAYSGSPDAV